MKNYLIKVFYDNGIEEIYNSGEVTKETMDKIATVVMNSFSGANGHLQVPNDDGLSIFVDLSKVSKVEFLNDVAWEQAQIVN